MNPLATRVLVDDSSLTVILQDGRELQVPLARFPRLARASVAQRQCVRISKSGRALHWDELDEDIDVDELLRGRD
ncbi:DUF2442 domain-containing protein [Paraburkholderia silviterrae]|uniref:DUF2442 domain-containing protein n=1 Tax=Paraburkholderia silviterrae TaxID=2528715 RepID=A0A4R5MC26_9BURK|nr:DUF2442 domain-containing protein [Paraburkholderia silviterrae]TDG24476.1 DUF2442 domain-containing protein [Paraburkholderia silviterrae]